MSKLQTSPHTAGRFVLGGTTPWHELTAGDVIEIQINRAWVPVRIEHNGERYYALAGDVRIDLRAGMLARRIKQS